MNERLQPDLLQEALRLIDEAERVAAIDPEKRALIEGGIGVTDTGRGLRMVWNTMHDPYIPAVVKVWVAVASSIVFVAALLMLVFLVWAISL